MLDLRLIRRDPEAVRTALARRGPAAAERLDRVVALDARWREATQTSEALRAEQKAASERSPPASARAARYPSSSRG